MSINIKDSKTSDLIHRLAEATGETLTEAVRIAVQERLRRLETRRGDANNLARRLDEIACHCASLPMRQDRTDDEILGYNERGLPD